MSNPKPDDKKTPEDILKNLKGLIDVDAMLKAFGRYDAPPPLELHPIVLPFAIEARLVYDDQHRSCNSCRDLRMLVAERDGRGVIFYEEIMRHPKLVNHLNKIWPAFPPKRLYK